MRCGKMRCGAIWRCGGPKKKEYDLMPYNELRVLQPHPSASLTELNSHTNEYLDYYLGTGDARRINKGDDTFAFWITDYNDFAKFDPNNQTAQEIADEIVSSFAWAGLPQERLASITAEAQQGLWVECYPD